MDPSIMITHHQLAPLMSVYQHCTILSQTLHRLSPHLHILSSPCHTHHIIFQTLGITMPRTLLSPNVHQLQETPRHLALPLLWDSDRFLLPRRVLDIRVPGAHEGGQLGVIARCIRQHPHLASILALRNYIPNHRSVTFTENMAIKPDIAQATAIGERSTTNPSSTQSKHQLLSNQQLTPAHQGCAVEPVNRNRSALLSPHHNWWPRRQPLSKQQPTSNQQLTPAHTKAAQSSRLTAIGARSLLTRHIPIDFAFSPSLKA